MSATKTLWIDFSNGGLDSPHETFIWTDDHREIIYAKYFDQLIPGGCFDIDYKKRNDWFAEQILLHLPEVIYLVRPIGGLEHQHKRELCSITRRQVTVVDEQTFLATIWRPLQEQRKFSNALAQRNNESNSRTAELAPQLPHPY